jgi:hypothetical protein
MTHTTARSARTSAERAGADQPGQPYETAARASEVLALNIEDLDLDARRAPIRSKGGDTEWICWGSGTAHLLPRLIRGRQAGPVFLSESPGPARRPAAQDLCPATGRARLGYDRARILFTRHTGWQRHQLRHSAATHLGEQGIPLQLIMAKTRHRNPRTAMRTSAQVPKPSLKSPPCSNLHADEVEQYLPTLRPAAASVLSRSLSASNITTGRNRATGGA